MALLGRRAAALTPVNSHRLSDQTESPNVPGLNACPATPPAKARSKRRGRGGALDGAEGGERWAFAACLAVGSGLWCALLRLFLKRHRFPYHRHRTEAAALYGLPPLVFAGLLARRPRREGRSARARRAAPRDRIAPLRARRSASTRSSIARRTGQGRSTSTELVVKWGRCWKGAPHSPLARSSARFDSGASAAGVRRRRGAASRGPDLNHMGDDYGLRRAAQRSRA